MSYKYDLSCAWIFFNLLENTTNMFYVFDILSYRFEFSWFQSWCDFISESHYDFGNDTKDFNLAQIWALISCEDWGLINVCFYLSFTGSIEKIFYIKCIACLIFHRLDKRRGDDEWDCRTLPRARRRGDTSSVAGIRCWGLSVVKKGVPPSIMVTRKPNWSFRDSKARDWLRKGKVLAPLVRPT